jgi:hypothetical protein
MITCYAQTSTITGNVKDEEGNDVPRISVTLKQVADSMLLSYAYSDDRGNYQLTFAGEEKELLIGVSGLGIATQIKKIQNKTQTVDFVVREKEIQLKEVVIKSQKIAYDKDTINYSVAAFSDDKDFSIGDVMEKMPGIDVTKSGQINYQGQPINKFYIENLDLLQGRYGIATQNIRAKDVSTVQVLENHQPIKAMDSLRISNQAAINLKLKEEAKGTLSVTAQLGAGISPFLWDNGLTGMYFAKKKQNITTYKANNTGNDLTKELRSFYTSWELLPEQITHIQMPSPPDIGRNRYLFNNSHAATSNNLFNIGKDKELNLNIIYYNDYEKRESEARSSYFITSDSLLQMDEYMQSSVNTNRLETEIQYHENNENQYVNNLLNLEGSWEDGRGNIRTGTAIDQRLHRPSMKVQNDFFLLKRSGRRGFEFNSRTGYRSSPQNLSISPGLYADLLNHDREYAGLRQDIRAYTLISDNNLTFIRSFLIGNVVVNPMFGFNLEMNQLASELYPQDESGHSLSAVADSMKNNLTRSQYKTYAGLNMDYKIGKFRLNTYLPVSYNYYQLNNKLYTVNNENLHQFYFEPSLNVQYIPSHQWDINANASFYNRMNGIYELYNGYLLQSYRNLNHYNSQLSGSEGNSQSFRIAYKDILRMLFVNGTVSRNQNKSDVIYVQNFKDHLLLTSIIKEPNVRTTLFASGKISKSFDWMRFSTDLNFSYLTAASRQIRQDNPVDYRNNQVNASVRLSAVPVSGLIISYEGAGQQSLSKMETDRIFTPIRSFTNTLNTDVTLFKNFRIGAQFEQYYNNVLQNDKYRYFVDLSMNYEWKQVRFEMDWRNILNTKNYVTAYLNDMDEYHYNYTIRQSNLLFKVRFKLK